MTDDVQHWMDLAEEAAHLRMALASRAPIEQAKGAISVLRGISGEAAWQEIRQVSMNHNVRLHELCEVVVAVVAREDVSRFDVRVRQAVLDGWACELAVVRAALER